MRDGQALELDRTIRRVVALAPLLAIVGAEYLLKLLPRGTHSYASFIKPSELAAHTRRAGLTTIELKGMEYNPLTQIYTLSGNTSVNYLVATRKE